MMVRRTLDTFYETLERPSSNPLSLRCYPNEIMLKEQQLNHLEYTLKKEKEMNKTEECHSRSLSVVEDDCKQ